MDEVNRRPVPLALVEVLGADGHVRQSVPVWSWPVAIGRAVDNHVVLDDPHVAAHHLELAGADAAAVAAGTGAAGVFAEVGDTRNGVELSVPGGGGGASGARRLAAGAVARLDHLGAPVQLTVGRTRLRVRLQAHALEPEVPLLAAGAGAAGWRRHAPLAAGLVLLVGMLAFQRWLDSDADLYARAAGGALLTLAASASVWCGAWALLSRIFTRQARLGWHVRVFVYASVAYMVVDAIAAVLAFALDWTWLADFAFVAGIAVAGCALTYHLYAVEPARPQLARGIGTLAALGGIALTLWMNFQRSDHFGQDLYMSHLLPPALRLAGTVPVDRFVDGLAALQPDLDRKARESDNGDESDDDGEN